MMEPLRSPHATVVAVLAGWVVVLVLGLARPTGAEQFVVDSTMDAGPGSLRTAVTDANASADLESSISFSPPALGTITVTSSLPTIGQALSIDGQAESPADLLVRGPGAGTALYELDAGTTLTLRNAPFEAGDIVLGNGAVTVFDVSFDQTVDQVIRNAVGATGGILKVGPAELRLAGANAYTGNTAVTEGTLVVTSTSLPGNVTVSDEGLLAFDEAMGAAAVFSRDIQGPGGIEKRGAGTLTLSGTNSFTGGTTILEGRLASTPSSLTGNVAVEQDATFELIGDAGMDETFSGSVSGAGTLEKTGLDRVLLESNNTVSNLRVVAGTLAGGTNALSGNGQIEAGATLEIADDDGGTLTGDLGGSGNVLSSGTGVVRLEGINTVARLDITDGRVVGASTASIPLAVDVVTPGVLTFNPAADGSYGGVITGTGDVEKRGSATLELTQAQAFTGTTRVQAGRLQLAAGSSLAADVEIESGATLSGSGSVNGRVLNAGTLAASDAERITVNELRLTAGSLLVTTVDPALAADLVTVTNGALLTAGTLDVELAPGSYAIGQQFTLVDAGTLDGLPAFDNPSLFFDLALAEVGERLVLTVTPTGSSFEAFARTRNQQSVAQALDQERPTASGDLETVIQAIESLTSGVPEAYDALGGEQTTQLTTARLEIGDRLDRAIHTRLRERGDRIRLSEAAGEGRPPVSLGEEPLGTGMWLEPFGVFGDVEGRQGAHDTDYRIGGVMLGGDLVPVAGARLGAAFTYGHTSLDYDGLGGTASGNSYLGALYGGWDGGLLRVGLSSRIGYSDMESERRIRISTLDRTARADFSGLDFGGRLEAGARLIRSERAVVEPYVSVGYVHLERSRIDEKGADSVNLHASREEIDSALVGAGIRARAIFHLDADLVILPEIHAEWNQQVADRDRRVDATLEGATAGSRTRVYGTELHRNGGLAGTAWTVRSSQGLDLRFGYDVGYGTDRVSHAVGVTINATW